MNDRFIPTHFRQKDKTTFNLIETALKLGVFGALPAGLAFSVGHGAIAQWVSNKGRAYIAHSVAQEVVSVLQGAS